jgi:hypothetical protein
LGFGIKRAENGVRYSDPEKTVVDFMPKDGAPAVKQNFQKFQLARFKSGRPFSAVSCLRF